MNFCLIKIICLLRINGLREFINFKNFGFDVLKYLDE
jgi:hypothetical protein